MVKVKEKRKIEITKNNGLFGFIVTEENKQTEIPCIFRTSEEIFAWIDYINDPTNDIEIEHITDIISDNYFIG